MRIVNQEMSRSFNLDRLEIYINESEIHAHDGNRNWILGRYESIERAKQVFIEIHHQMDGVCMFENCLMDENTILALKKVLNNVVLNVKTSDKLPRVEMVNALVIYMPKE